MKCLFAIPCLALLLLLQPLACADETTEVDIRRAVPDNVYLMVYGKHNPERDFQREYYQQIWNTVEETKIIERAIQIVTKRLAEEDVDRATGIIQEIRDAVAPINIKQLSNCQEMIYAQRTIVSDAQQQPIQIPTADHLLLLRATPDVVASTAEGITNLFRLVEKYSQGDVPVESTEQGAAKITTLAPPPPVPMQPTVVVLDDVLLISSSRELAAQSLAMLQGEDDAASKFEDQRLQDALSQLPEPEDSLVFYDGRTQFENMKRLGTFLRQMAQGDANAGRIADLVDLVFNELSVFDYEVTVEYTEGNQNRSATRGQLLPDTEDKMLVEMLAGGEPFTQWHSWVPADALSYSLSTGINLHHAYEEILAIIREQVPESAEMLAQFEQLQEQYDVHLDRDILQAFSGETVSISMPATAADGAAGKSVTAMRCHKPERIRELIHRAMDALQQIPAVQAQQIKLVESAELEGFEELSGMMLQAFRIKPVIGFQDGWMYLGSSTAAVQEVLDTRAGQGETVEKTDDFQRFELEVDGPVQSIEYTNLAENTRQMAATVNQVGNLLPVVLAMAGVNASPEDLEPVQETLALLPDLSKIIAQFDFFESKISVMQAGNQPGSYVKRSVTIVRAAD